MRDQWSRLLCGNTGQSDEQYSARSVCYRLSARYVLHHAFLLVDSCAYIAFEPTTMPHTRTVSSQRELVINRCVILGISRSLSRCANNLPTDDTLSAILSVLQCANGMSRNTTDIQHAITDITISTVHPTSIRRTRSRTFRPSGPRTTKVTYSIATIWPSFTKHTSCELLLLLLLLLPPLLLLLLSLCCSVCAHFPSQAHTQTHPPTHTHTPCHMPITKANACPLASLYTRSNEHSRTNENKLQKQH